MDALKEWVEDRVGCCEGMGLVPVSGLGYTAVCQEELALQIVSWLGIKFFSCDRIFQTEDVCVCWCKLTRLDLYPFLV